MAPSDRLKPVQRVAQNKEREAAKSFGDSRRKLQEEEQKLEQLRLFEQEYQNRFEAASRGGMSAGQLQEYQGFIAKLHLTIKEQENVVEQCRKFSGDMKQHWQEKHTRTEAIGKVMGRFEKEEHQERERMEQKLSDEFSNRARRSEQF